MSQLAQSVLKSIPITSKSPQPILGCQRLPGVAQLALFRHEFSIYAPAYGNSTVTDRQTHTDGHTTTAYTTLLCDASIVLQVTFTNHDTSVSVVTLGLTLTTCSVIIMKVSTISQLSVTYTTIWYDITPHIGVHLVLPITQATHQHQAEHWWINPIHDFSFAGKQLAKKTVKIRLRMHQNSSFWEPKAIFLPRPLSSVWKGTPPPTPYSLWRLNPHA